jgi:hypothetical protein
MRFPRILSALLLTAYLPACTSYQATSQTVVELTAFPKPPAHIRVTTTDGANLVVDAPRVVHDSLFGTTEALGPRGEPTTRIVAIPVAELHSVEVKKPDGTKTLVLAAGVVGAFVLVGAAMSSAMDLGGYTPMY